MASEIKTSGFRQFLILLYKGLLLRKRHYVITAFELVIPIFIASIPAIIESELSSQNAYDAPIPRSWINVTYYESFDPLKQRTSRRDSEDVLFIYTPSNAFTDKLMSDAISVWNASNGKHRISKEFAKDEYELETHAYNLRKMSQDITILGTIFNNPAGERNNSQTNLNYKIRYGTTYGLSSFNTNLKYDFSGPKQSNDYTFTFFLSWQAALEKAFVEQQMLKEGKNVQYELSMQRFPYPGHREKLATFSVINLIAWVIGYGFAVFFINIVNTVIEEKKNGLKELLKMMGMTDSLYWISNFMNFFGLGALAMLIITIIYKSPLKNSYVLVKYTDFTVLFVLLLLFMATLTLFSLAFSTFFNKPIFGVIVMIIVYSLSFSLLMEKFFLMKIDQNYLPLPFLAKFGICLLPPGALLTIFSIISFYEHSGEGAHWYNLTEYVISPDFNLMTVMAAMIFSCFIYIVIIWYVDAVWPWQYGVPKPFYFPFTKSYWLGYSEKTGDHMSLVNQNENSSDFFEDDPPGATPGVIIHNLSKVFKSGFRTKKAVSDVSLNIYSGQITALLGHNGAGKTTTVNILTGLYTPTSGTASINGWDISTHTVNARRSVGVCPQHDVLYGTLTVEEHLKIYAGLKGVAWNKINSEAAKVIEMLHLTEKKNDLAKNLSGGMKRKLSLGIAIIGGSKVLFLDEPTSGLDVEARRIVWDVLLDIRHDRTIILTTHYMEEADILGDRVAIMADGELQCCGSPMFLKRKFGTGYHLHLVKDDQFDLSSVSELLLRYIPTASLESNSDKEVTFVLSPNAESMFGDMFEDLERNKDSLGVNSCGVTVTTMEDVFLNVANNISNIKSKIQGSERSQNGILLSDEGAYDTSMHTSEPASLLNQLIGLLIKRVHYTKRFWSVLTAQVLLPFLLMCWCFSSITSQSHKSQLNYPPLKLSIAEVYGHTKGFYKSDGNNFINHLIKVFGENQVTLEKTKSPNQLILKYAEEDLSLYLKRLSVGSSVKQSSDGKLNITMWYNGEPYHILPMSLSLANTALLRHASNAGTITLTNAPLPDVFMRYQEETLRMVERITANCFVPMAFSFLSASFVLIPIHERISKAKLLQLMTGVHPALYWLSMFIWDGLTHLIVNFILIIPFAMFGSYAFFSSNSNAIGTILLMLFMYGWASIPFSYLFSFVFKKPSSGFSAITTCVVITGIVVCSILSTIQVTAGKSYVPAIDIPMWVFRIFPSFCLSSGVSKIFATAYNNAFCDGVDPNELKMNCESKFMNNLNVLYKCCKNSCNDSCLVKNDFLTWDKDSCGRDMLFLFIDGIVFILLLLLVETTYIKKCVRFVVQRVPKFRKIEDNQLTRDSCEDSEVLAEEERVRNICTSTAFKDLANDDAEEALLAFDLTKVYKNFHAVDHLTFGINKEECFGLLGVNGAGKTTTFRMLTGDCFPTEGNAFSKGLSLITDLEKFQSLIGYCPQFDALIDRLTGREMITLFARLRGLSGSKMTEAVDNLIKMTDLTEHADKQSTLYSGGNKRKLSIAIALVGSPPLILLDEPTAGVDPMSRRKIWNILSQARKCTGAAIVLTTHSMEESEALCGRLAIMVNGRFRCLGSIQQLKTKYGQGYTLMIKLKRETTNDPGAVSAIRDFVETSLQGAELKDYHQGMLQYHINDVNTKFSQLFKLMDGMKPRFDLEDYLISDTSLEQIFLTFARTQRENPS